YELPFPLLADVEQQVAEQYGVLTTLGSLKFAKRETFLVNPDGVIAKHYSKVNPDEHAKQVLADLETLMGPSDAPDAS
ncbi:MAG: redoxin domain-containing protein, partial [Proteobacteria bacterium]|nr:redoxin domain-containing protein [Pseudomonadota bacterium]